MRAHASWVNGPSKQIARLQASIGAAGLRQNEAHSALAVSFKGGCKVMALQPSLRELQANRISAAYLSDWRLPLDMRKREATRGHYLPAFVAGGPDNPFGAHVT